MIRITFVLILLAFALLVALTIPDKPLPIPLMTVRFLLGLAVILFCPGYALQAALFPRRDRLDGIDRLALSIGISLALIPLIALLLDQLPWGISLRAVVGAEAGVTIPALAVAWARWRRLDKDRRERTFSLPGFVSVPKERSRFWLYTGMSAILAAGLLLLLVVIRLAETGGGTTEFYLLGSEGRAGDYPRRALIGRPITVTVGIVNREKTEVEYRLEVVDRDTLLGQSGPIRLASGAAYEGSVSFTPTRAGDPVRVQFLLYRNGLPVPYRSLWLWLKVEE